MSQRNSRSTSSELKILKNATNSVNPKQILDCIKTISKQTQSLPQAQIEVSKQLSLLFKSTISVSIVPIKEAPEGQPISRDINPYPEPSIILQDSQSYYRIWLEERKTFGEMKNFRKPAERQIPVMELKDQDYTQN